MNPQSLLGVDPSRLLARKKEYDEQRAAAVEEEDAMAFDHVCKAHATDAERRANAIIQRLRSHDRLAVYGPAGSRRGYGQQEHPYYAGDHFLTNRALIDKTQLFRVAQKMPKGAHLHIHFNACLLPRELLLIAKDMDRMFITSDLPLAVGDDAALAGLDSQANFFLCEIQFSILSADKEDPANIFTTDYRPRQTMHFQQFLREFPQDVVGMSAMDWLESKLVFGEDETYDIPQNSLGAWERFNGRTRMMKGLFNYVTAYKKYTRLFLLSLQDDHIQYAEIRPNFMMTNQLWTDDGLSKVDNAGIMEIIVQACDDFKAEKRALKGWGIEQPPFQGIKIIYCTPRVFSPDLVRQALEECLQFKQRWPDYIAGFDLVGEEAKGHPLKAFASEFLAFQLACEAADVRIPFLFHCGETLDVGTDIDGNLFDALAFGAKRIGHGFALPRHPRVMQAMKDRGVCVEICPISNEILGLTPRIGGHAVYTLLAHNMPCTVNSDNGTLFRSTLSHDFYQLLIGKEDMGIYGWRQLAMWSLKHSCLEPAELEDALSDWLGAWRRFIVWLLETYDADDVETQEVLAAIASGEQEAAKCF